MVQDYFEKAQFDEALAFLQKGLKQLPDNAGLLYQLGHAYIQKSDWENAESVIQQIGASPDPHAKYNFQVLTGEYHRERKEYQKAIQSYDQADKLLDPEMDFLKGINQKYCRDLMKQKK